MAEFYDNEADGKLHVRLPAGGGAGGHTGYVDRVATEADVREHELAHRDYLAAKVGTESQPAPGPVEEAAHETIDAAPVAAVVSPSIENVKPRRRKKAHKG